MPVVRLALHQEKCVRVLGEKVSSVDGVIRYVQREYGCAPQEYVVAVALSGDNRVKGLFEVHVGALDSSIVDPKMLFAGLLLMGATAFVLVHNHPSGDPEPSQADFSLTRQISTGAKTLAIRFLDHVVVSGSGVYSFLAHGHIPVG